ncbi:type IV secretion protein Rhs [Pseudomonas aylmerensis]|uniref:Type IV secretion protein Rhs n=1 Tax=Pseudomonas aylmerensis TaxID=1869229 RepID=A0A2T4GC03_9PSED|nr:RHS repeat-associated core domain-containing protein [Pseudomonas aylmerensis]OCW23533.1 type IV secretion protein Rhs [Pseudomonas aylmerensis]PTC33210.1 type IV secretion protein Rhs [Pseudomonas aylmerensis]
MNVYSNAFNFSSYLSGSVDVRTGQYSSQIRLVTLYPQGALEASRDITLMFSMMNTSALGYGLGWRLSNTEFDISTQRLTLLSGEQFKTQALPPVNGTLVIQDRKLKDLVVKRPTSSTLQVIYKDGTIEVLERTGSNVPYRIVAMLFENGERLIFDYEETGFLDRILNHKQEELLVLTYSGQRLVTADARVDGGRYARVRFTYTNDRLTGVTAPYDRSEAQGTAAYVFKYRKAFRNGLVALEQVQSPMGGQELITYDENGHQYANNQYIPRVIRWVQSPGASQPDMIRTYAYSTGRNFTGFPFSGGFREGEDNLYLIGSDYNYCTEETSRDANDQVLSVTETTYNKFHLLTEELVRREGTLTKTSITYNTNDGLFPAQPANLHLPKTITKRYGLVAGGAAREEIQHIETDEFGNPLSRTETSGIRTEYSYYPIAGEGSRCPADPHKLFQRYVKHERLVPVGGSPAARLTEYTYTRVPQTGSSYFVLQQSSSQAGGLAMQQTYYETPVALAGRLKSTTSTVDGQALTSDFSYVIQGDNLIETRRLNGSEVQGRQWLEAKRTLSLVNRRLLSMTRDGDSTLDLAFDVSGRLVTETVSPGTLRKATRQYAYHFAQEDKHAHLITTDAKGVTAVTYYDGAGRQVSDAQRLGLNQERVIRTWRYDTLGQTVEVVSYDYLDNGQRVLESPQTYTYSPWGNASTVTRPDGSVAINEYDPRLNLTEEGVVGSERRITYFNAHNQPIKVERLDANGNKVEVESRTYDGLGRCLTSRDINATLTEFSYDGFDRLLTTLQKPTDGTPQRERKTEYAPGTSSGDRVSAFTVAGKLLATRTYDSLGRMTRQARGTGQATTWEYEAGWLAPVAMVSPRGARQRLTYDKELDVPTQIEMTGLPESGYQHDPVSGALTRSESNRLVRELFYDTYGQVEKEVQSANGAALTTLNQYSPGGRLLEQTGADGQKSQLEYDALGRFSKITTGALVIEQSYDTLGRPQSLTTTHDRTKILTRLTYDALGRETDRTFEQNGVLLQVMTSTYRVNSLLATRVLTDASSRVLIGETFTYDAYLRLKAYRCTGLEHPKDHLGRGIVGEDFTFDSLNNITQVITFFADGTQDTCERYFTGTDPTQLTRLTHTRPVQEVTLTYDAAGNLLASPEGHIYTFNSFEQLTTVQVGTLKYSYQYDAESRQVQASRGDEPPVMLAYNGERLETLVEGNKKIRYADGGDQVMARTGGVDGPQVYANDAAGSVRGISAAGQAHVRRHYTPYGDTHIRLDDGKVRSMADLQLQAFNGQRLDAATNLYFLGNGLRAYCPSLYMYVQADPTSPIDEGGINSYAYCAGNPVNLMDPNGLWPNWLKWVLTGAALALAVVSLGSGSLALAAAVAAYSAKAAATAAVGATAAVAAKATAAAAIIKAGLGVSISGLGSVGGVLSVTSLSIEAVDHQMGWDRSNHLKGLGWASFGFSIASWTVSFAAAARGAISAYTGLAATSRSGAASKGASEFVKSFSGYGFRFYKKAKDLDSLIKSEVTSGGNNFSKVFGVTRFTVRTTNLGRAIEGRVNALRATSSSGDGQSSSDAGPPAFNAGAGESTQSQSYDTSSSVLDMPASSFDYYQSFRDEASRIRQPILGELYRG